MIKYKYTDYVEQYINVDGFNDYSHEPSENLQYSLEPTYKPTLINTIINNSNENLHDFNYTKSKLNLIFVIGLSIGIPILVFLLIILEYKKKICQKLIINNFIHKKMINNNGLQIDNFGLQIDNIVMEEDSKV